MLLENATAIYKKYPKLEMDNPMWKIKIDYRDGMLEYQVLLCDETKALWNQELNNITFYVTYQEKNQCTLFYIAYAHKNNSAAATAAEL